MQKIDMTESSDSFSSRRSDYKKVWNDLSITEEAARASVGGSKDETALIRSGTAAVNFLLETAGIGRDDVVLEIGCGIGRVGKQVAPRCRKWIGCDVSPNMLKLATARLRQFPNVELFETSGYDLRPIADCSVDLVYCTVVFMHLEEWDRYSYVEEGFRILRPGGKLFVDNVNLCSDAGWAVFEKHRQFPPRQRPAHITQCSTPQELEEYLKRAGFVDIETKLGGDRIHAWGTKPPRA